MIRVLTIPALFLLSLLVGACEEVAETTPTHEKNDSSYVTSEAELRAALEAELAHIHLAAPIILTERVDLDYPVTLSSSLQYKHTTTLSGEIIRILSSEVKLDGIHLYKADPDEKSSRSAIYIPWNEGPRDNISIRNTTLDGVGGVFFRGESKRYITDDFRNLSLTGNTIKNYTGAGIQLWGGTNVVITGNIINQSVNTKASATNNGMYIRYCDTVVVSNNTVNNAEVRMGIEYLTVNNGVIISNVIRNFNSMGLSVAHGSKNVSVTGNTINGCYDPESGQGGSLALEIADLVTDVTVTGNTVTDAYQLLSCEGADATIQNVNIIGNTFARGYKTGANSRTIQLYKTKDVVFSNNHLIDLKTDRWLFLNESHQAVVENNVFRDQQNWGGHGIYHFGGKGNIIRNNTFYQYGGSLVGNIHNNGPAPVNSDWQAQELKDTNGEVIHTIPSSNHVIK